MTEDNRPESPPSAPNVAPKHHAIRNIIFDQTAEATELAISRKIDDKKNQIRNGDGSLWGMLKGFIFQLAELFHFDRWLAHAFGTPIPEDHEVKAAARQVADSVSSVLVDDPAVATMTREELQGAITKRVKTDLQQHHNAFPSFNEGQIAEIAAKAGQKTGDNLPEIKDQLYPPPPLVRNIALMGSPDEQIKQALSDMADGLMSGKVSSNKAAALEPVKQSMIAIGVSLIKDRPELIQQPDELAMRYANVEASIVFTVPLPSQW